MDFSDQFEIVYTSNSASERLEILSSLPSPIQNKMIIQLQTKACANGYLGLLRWLDETFHSRLTSVSTDLIFEHGHLDLIQWVYNTNPSFFRETRDLLMKLKMDTAIENGHYEFVKYLIETHNLSCTENALFKLEDGMSKSLDKEKYKRLLDLLTTYFACFNPASDQYIKSLYLHLIDLCCISGNLAMLKWIYQRFPDRFAEAYRDENFVDMLIDDATRHSNLTLLEWMYRSTEDIRDYDVFARKYIFRHPSARGTDD